MGTASHGCSGLPVSPPGRLPGTLPAGPMMNGQWRRDHVAHSRARQRAARDQEFRLLVTGGGTGGHTYPAVTVVAELRARLAADGRPAEVLWAGTAGSLEERVAAEAAIPFTAVAAGKLRRAGNPLRMLTPANLADMARVPLGVAQAWRLVRRYRPDVVLATGGYVAVPVGVAAWLCRRPLVMHEQTTRLGLANRLLARGAASVAVSSESTLALLPARARARAVETGNPVRPQVLAGRAGAAAAALGWRGADPTLPTVYVTGGAQGSAQINRLVSAILPWLLERANVIHQCGAVSLAGLRDQHARLPARAAARYHLAGFVGAELPDVLALADVVVSRSGAGTIAEIAALGRAAVLVPLATSAGDEQRHNARHLAQAGAAVALLDEATPDGLRAALGPLLADPSRRAQVSAAARRLGRPEAASLLADAVLTAAGYRAGQREGRAVVRRGS
jgi:UDP-N-acetylglucosamine--N-acetylmuramyl-(pentapeptide) pyrophosphoryl-undecaprenol N-acetylglucosamine transferase